MKFIEHPCGLYVYDAGNASSDGVDQYTMVATIAAQRANVHPPRSCGRRRGPRLYRKLGRPSEANVQHLLAPTRFATVP
jgi:hypothetical protein